MSATIDATAIRTSHPSTRRGPGWGYPTPEHSTWHSDIFRSRNR